MKRHCIAPIESKNYRDCGNVAVAILDYEPKPKSKKYKPFYLCAACIARVKPKPGRLTWLDELERAK